MTNCINAPDTRRHIVEVATLFVLGGMFALTIGCGPAPSTAMKDDKMKKDDIMKKDDK